MNMNFNNPMAETDPADEQVSMVPVTDEENERKFFLETNEVDDSTMVAPLVPLLSVLSIFSFAQASVETLHFESACLPASNQLQIRLQCSLYEHIDILRVIYGYSKQGSCRFSIYDCIQEGASRNILSCNGKETCLINLTKEEILRTTVTTAGVPDCSEFNYVQVNFACVPDAKDICDSWKEEGPVIHLSHTNSKEKEYHQCQCKVRSSQSNGQVLLHAREMNRHSSDIEDFQTKKNVNTDCKKTTYLEIGTDRSERKCMDNLPASGNALFGSGSHNFTLTYVRNDPLSDLFFYLELKASPAKKDHHVQIVCNWARRTTTVRTTFPPTRQRRLTTNSMLGGGRLSRLDLIRHASNSDEDTSNLEDDEESSTETVNLSEEDENIIRKTKSRKERKTSTTVITTGVVADLSDEEEWSRVLSKSSLSSDNETFLSSVQASVLSAEENSSSKYFRTKLLLIVLLVISAIIFLLTFFCLKRNRPSLIQRFRMNANVALLFCCEAGKLLFSSSKNTSTAHRRSSPSPMADYQSSEYYMNETGNPCHTTQSIYDDVGKSISSVDDASEEYGYTTNSNRQDQGDTC